jgi:proteic killer suppression protein
LRRSGEAPSLLLTTAFANSSTTAEVTDLARHSGLGQERFADCYLGRGYSHTIDNILTLDVINEQRYGSVVLRSFADKYAEAIWNRRRVRKFDPLLARIALRKLLILDAAMNLNDLRVPPGNRLEKLKGDRAGQHSIRINDQWRICFKWTGSGPTDVEIVDYH